LINQAAVATNRAALGKRQGYSEAAEVALTTAMLTRVCVDRIAAIPQFGTGQTAPSTFSVRRRRPGSLTDHIRDDPLRRTARMVVH